MPVCFRWRGRDRGAARVASAMPLAMSVAMSVTLLGALAAFPAPASAAEPSSDAGDHAAFLAENDRAMERMMNDMAIAPSGDVDRDFVHMMVPHHRGAIEMAMAQLRHGRNPQLRRIAQEIIATQQQEIAAMYLAIGQAPPVADTSANTSANTSADTSADTAAVAGSATAGSEPGHRAIHHSHKEPR